MKLLLDSIFTAVALGHLTVDMMNGQRAILLAYLSAPLGLSNTTLGLVSTVYVSMGAVSQPLFGLVADRVGSRWVAALGMIWMGTFFSLALISPGSATLWWLVFASLGSGALHPAGAMQASVQGKVVLAGRETTAASYFFFFGQFGGFLGPLLGGTMIDRYGAWGLLPFSLAALPAGINIAHHLRRISWPRSKEEGLLEISEADNSQPSVLRRSFFTTSLLTLVIMTACQAWVQQNLFTFLPKYLNDLGLPASIYGVLSAVFMGGVAIGNMVGGNLADRLGRRRVASLSLSLAVLPLVLIAKVGWTPWLFLLIPLAGALNGATHSIIVVSAQHMIPSGMATASGMILGFMFTAGAIGTLLTGSIADAWGFQAVFLITAGIAVFAALAARALRDVDQQSG